MAKPNFLTKEELDTFLALSEEADTLQALFGGPSYMDVTLDASILCRIKTLLGYNKESKVEEEESSCEDVTHEGVVGLQSSTGTAPLHTDFDCNDEPVEDEVVLILLNTNRHASFVHGDKEEAIEAGKLLVFKGNVPHHLKKDVGIVRMLGPFQLSSFCMVRHSKASDLILSGRDLQVDCTPAPQGCGAPTVPPNCTPKPSSTPSDFPSSVPSAVPSETPPEDVIQGIIDGIEGSDDITIDNALTTKLNKALERLEDGNETGAIQIIEALLNQVISQRGKKIPEGDADKWIDMLTSVIESLGGAAGP